MNNITRLGSNEIINEEQSIVVYASNSDEFKMIKTYYQRCTHLVLRSTEEFIESLIDLEQAGIKIKRMYFDEVTDQLIEYIKNSEALPESIPLYKIDSRYINTLSFLAMVNDNLVLKRMVILFEELGIEYTHDLIRSLKDVKDGRIIATIQSIIIDNEMKTCAGLSSNSGLVFRLTKIIESSEFKEHQGCLKYSSDEDALKYAVRFIYNRIGY